MSFYCPEIAILHSSFALIEKQIGKGKLQKITKEKCRNEVNIVYTAIEEIVSGLEEENTIEEQVYWQEKLHDILLYKVCQSYDKEQPISDENTVLDNTEILAQIFPSFGSVFYIELIKKCGWSTLFFARLESLPSDITRNILSDIVEKSVEDDIDLVFLIEVLDFIVSRFLTVSHDETFVSPKAEESSSSQTCFTVSVINSILKTLNDCDLVKICENIANGNLFSSAFSHFDGKLLLQDCIAQLLILGMFALAPCDQNQNHLRRWLYLHVRGTEIDYNERDDILPSQMFYKISGLGKYKETLLNAVTLDLNLKLVTCLQQDLSWTVWSSVIGNFLKTGALIPETAPKFNLSKCPLHIKSKPASLQKTKSYTVAVILDCSLVNLLATAHQKFSQKTNILPEDVLERINVDMEENVDYSLESVTWRIDKRQPGFQVCIEELLRNKHPLIWTNDQLMKTLQKNIDLLSMDTTLIRLYDLVIELDGKLSDSAVLSLKRLVLSAFVELPADVMDRHIVHVYTKYRHWPNSSCLVTGEVTAAFNKLTTAGPSSEVNDIYKQVLQNPELLLPTIIERAITSKDQVTIFIQILKFIPSICKAGCYSNKNVTMLVHTLDSFLKKQRLSHKEQRNVLKFVAEINKVSSSGHLLDPAQFLTKSVLPFLNVDNLYNRSQPITAKFAFELFIEVIVEPSKMTHQGKIKEEQYIRNIFTQIDFTAIFLCICEIAHECIDLIESDDQLFSEKLKIKEDLIKFWLWLDCHEFMQNEFLHTSESWLKKMSDFDFTIQLIISGYTGSTELVKVYSDMCSEILKNRENIELNMIRLFSSPSTRCLNINDMVDKMEIQLDYTNTVVALLQVLPNLVNSEWENCFSFIGHMLRLNNLSVPYKTQDTEEGSALYYTACTELKISQMLHDATMLLQHTDVGQNKLSLYHYLKCYVRYLNEFVLKDGGHLESSDGQRSYILSEVFSHVVTATWWMDESDAEPCSVILLDIVCSLEEEIVKDVSKKSLIHSVDDNLNLIKNADTSSMIRKKVMEILRCDEK